MNYVKIEIQGLGGTFYAGNVIEENHKKFIRAAAAKNELKIYNAHNDESISCHRFQDIFYAKGIDFNHKIITINNSDKKINIKKSDKRLIVKKGFVLGCAAIEKDMRLMFYFRSTDFKKEELVFNVINLGELFDNREIIISVSFRKKTLFPVKVIEGVAITSKAKYLELN